MRRPLLFTIPVLAAILPAGAGGGSANLSMAQPSARTVPPMIAHRPPGAPSQPIARRIGLSLRAVTRVQSPAASADAPKSSGWQIPDTALSEQSPVAATPQTLKQGQALYVEHCQSCHGVEGKGDGPDADPDAKPDDLSDPKRAKRNPDGVMFYKILNGRKKPEMPEFKSKLTKNEIWAVVQFSKSLRKMRG